MSRLFKVVQVLIFGTTTLLGADTAVVESRQAHVDVPLQTDPTSVFWSKAQPTYLEKDRQGKIEPNFRTEVRSRWTTTSLYFLFICPYGQLYLKPSPVTTQETNELWNWDVAEVFIGSNFSDIKGYQEFEVSPQGNGLILISTSTSPTTNPGGLGTLDLKRALGSTQQAIAGMQPCVSPCQRLTSGLLRQAMNFVRTFF